MRNLLWFIIGVVLYSCSSNEPVYDQHLRNSEVAESNSPAGQILKGDHRVKDIQEKGDMLTFMWETNNKEWVHSKLPINKVRYKYENTYTPYIKYKWRTGYEYTGINEVMENYVIYAVIVSNNPEFQ